MENITTAIVFFGLEMGFAFIGYCGGKMFLERLEERKINNQTVKISKRTVRI